VLMLLVGNTTFRRYWVMDPSKAQNNRLVALQHFDKELRMLKQALFESADSAKFELGVASLFSCRGLLLRFKLKRMPQT